MAWACDDKYVAPVLASIRSVISQANGSLSSIAIVSCGISSASKERLLQLMWESGTRLDIIELDVRLLDGLPSGFHTGAEVMSLAAYARLYLPSILPESWGRVVYLDPDTLTRSSLVELWNVDLAGAPFAAAQEPYCPHISSKHGVRDWEALGLNPHAPYFNSGVMLMDLAMWRSADLGPTAIDYARRNFHKLYQLDQEALNAVVDGRFYLLDPIWNVTSYWRREDRRTGAYTDILESARIRHFTGQFKPWLPAGKGQPHAEEFLAYYDGD